VKSSGAWLLLLLVRFYMLLLSPFFGGACKFHPSCSNYAYEAIALHGAHRGVLLALKRLLRCRPFTKGGFDPVPDVIARLPEGATFPVQSAQLSAASSPSEACIAARTLLPHRKTEPSQ
jgi:putative membrane protein insertion efficiency factor